MDKKKKYDKDLEYISNTQTLVGQQKKTYIDADTGEYVHVDQITKRVYGTKQFWKCYLMDFLSILGIMDNRQVDVFIYIVENTNPQTNLFIGTYNQIAKNINVSYGTVVTIMRKLIKNNFVKRVQNGLYLVNPNILMKGNDHKRQILLSYYRADEPINKISMNRAKKKSFPEDPASEEWQKNQLMIEGSED